VQFALSEAIVWSICVDSIKLRATLLTTFKVSRGYIRQTTDQRIMVAGHVKQCACKADLSYYNLTSTTNTEMMPEMSFKSYTLNYEAFSSPASYQLGCQIRPVTSSGRGVLSLDICICCFRHDTWILEYMKPQVLLEIL